MKVYKCKDTKEIVIGYKAYLHTLHWQNKRKHIYKIRNYTCEMCGCKIKKGQSYNIHHKTYKRVGNEKDSDLMLLCPDCHTLLHAKQNRQKEIMEFVLRLFTFKKYDKSKTRNRRPTQKWKNTKNGVKNATTNKKKSRKNN